MSLKTLACNLSQKLLSWYQGEASKVPSTGCYSLAATVMLNMVFLYWFKISDSMELVKEKILNELFPKMNHSSLLKTTTLKISENVKSKIL